jgi:hypothetical protein
MKIKTSELIGPALDWAVAECNGRGLDLEDPRDPWLTCEGIADQPLHSYTPHTDWAQGGPIIDREVLANGLQIGRKTVGALQFSCYAEYQGYMWEQRRMYYGPTPLIAAMRCYVASKLGDDVDVPEELLK